MAETKRIRPRRGHSLSLWLAVSSGVSSAVAFSFVSSPSKPWSCQRHQSTRDTRLHIIAPPGSGYARPEDEKSTFPDSYEPMMEYPGTMRPGRTPENMPFQDLPIADTDPDPVPWPHFQQIEWHHRWDPPHEHPIPMEEFIALHGRWATPEMEAAMRAGVRRNVRERRQQEEADDADRRNLIITDDDEDDDDDADVLREDPVALGDGVFGQLGSDADRAATAAAVDPSNQAKKETDQDDDDDDEEDEGLDDFLLSLGLDLDEDDEEDKSDVEEEEPVKGVSLTASGAQGDTTTINVDDDDDMVVLDDDDELESDTIPLDDYNDDSDTLDTEDIFDEGGFDFDDDFGGDMDGGDMW